MNIPGLKKDKQRKPIQVQHASMLHVAVNDPFLDWVLILCLSLLILITLAAIDASMYLDTTARLSAPPPLSARTAMSRVNTQALGDILSEFDRRATEQADPAKNFVTPKDPSLP